MLLAFGVEVHLGAAVVQGLEFLIGFVAHVQQRATQVADHLRQRLHVGLGPALAQLQRFQLKGPGAAGCRQLSQHRRHALLMHLGEQRQLLLPGLQALARFVDLGQQGLETLVLGRGLAG